MNKEEQAQLCALLAKLRFELSKIIVNQPSHKEIMDSVEMINKIMSICIMPDNIKVKK